MSRPAHQIIKRPILTEKGTRMKEHGGAEPGTFTEETVRPKVLFEVAYDANKIEIRHAVEVLFSVKVSGVRVAKTLGKIKKVGRSIGKSADGKKAYVKLKAGEKLPPIFEGV